VKNEKLLTDEMPPFDGIGANEFIVGVTTIWWISFPLSTRPTPGN
jgi:hypothetical protein